VNSDNQARRRDALFALSMVAVSVMTMWGLRNQPKAPYDPVGAAAIPFWTAAIVLALAVLLLVRTWTGKEQREQIASLFTSTEAIDDSYSVAPRLSIYAILVSIAYAAIIPLAGFMIASSLYMLVLGWLLSDRTPKAVAIVIGVALVGGIGLDLGFRALLVDLP
jgi:hypothetical protein